MAASPRSTGSSDLYSPSEPVPPRIRSQRGPFQEGAFQQSSEFIQIEEDESGYSDMMQGLDSAGDETSRPSSAAAGQVSNSFLPGTSHKRKRDQEMEIGQTMDDNSVSVSHTEGSPVPQMTGSYGFTNGNRSQWQDERPGNDPAGIERSNTRDDPLPPTKGTELSCKLSALPAVLWQHIFCFVPPVFLGRLLCVNHAFNSYLTPGNDREDPVSLPRSIMQPLRAEAIWVASRRRFAPGLPRPIHGLQELNMWRLLRGRKCQICGLVQDPMPGANSENLWESGPGEFGVRVVWPFGVRCCGSCLQNVSKKEYDLFLSSDCPSFLLQAIPFAFISRENHYIGHNLVRNLITPLTLQMTKYFYKPAIEDIKGKFEDAKALGAPSAEEWIKGLANQGQECIEDIIRWEQWESKGGLKKVNSRHHPKPAKIGPVNTGKKNIGVKDDSHSDQSTPQSMSFSFKNEGGQSSPAPPVSMDSAYTAPSGDPLTFHPAWNTFAPFAGGAQQGRQTPIYQPRPERNIRDVNEAKAARRAEIERRCAALEPPLLPNVLNHMESFQAAMQITQPMTDQAWQMLKPRLLAQLPYAERKEKERVQQNELLAEECKQRRQQEVQLKETKENIDREWETFQTPVRTRIGALADEVIETRWAGGRSVTKDISPKFAADVLIHVRQRFYAEMAREDEAALAAGEPMKNDSANGPPTRKLILENMKWLFDTKIKPLTDHFQRELFLCNGCDGNFKFYGFEGVIQHYAAKHTTTLSMGNIVVHWRAEWPEHPPFNPNPSVAKSAYYKVPTPSNPVQAPSARDSLGPATYGTYSQGGDAGSSTIPQRHDSSQYAAETHSLSYAGSRQEGLPHSLPAQSYPPPTTYGVGTCHSGAQIGFVSSASNYNQYTGAQQGQVPQVYGSSYLGQQPYPAFAQGQPSTNPQGYFAGPNANTYGNGPPVSYQPNYQNGIPPTHAPNGPGPVSDLYQRQMDEMAKHAKDVFTSIGGVKDLPGSVRIFVVIQLTVSRFKVTFPNEPSLSMFIDGLDHNPTMRPVRSVNGLGCKTCMESGTGAKLFTLPHLVNHFRTVHVESPQMLGYLQAPELDWKHDMIDLPDVSIISKLGNAAGMTDSKLGLIASVFPDLFPSPLPNMRGKVNTGPHPIYRKELEVDPRSLLKTPVKAMTDISPHLEDPSNEQSYSRPYSGFRPVSQDASSEPLEPPGEDEYDPHRPAFLGKIVKIEPSLVQSHRPPRPSMLQNGQRSSFQIQYEPSQNVPPRRIDNERPYDNTKAQLSRFGENFPDRPYEPKESLEQSQSPRPNLVSRSGGRRGMRAGEQGMTQRQTDVDNHDPPIEYGTRYGPTPESGSKAVGPRSIKREAQSVSPPEAKDAADQFLSSLAPGSDASHSRAAYPSDREIERRSDVPWEVEPQVKRRRKDFGEGDSYDQWPGEGAAIKRLENDLPVDHVRTGALEPRGVDQTGGSHESEPRAQYYDEYQPSSHVQIPLKPIRADENSALRYDPQQGGVHGRQETNASILSRPQSGHTYQATRMPQYGPASVSPHQVPADTAPYRPRSPVEEDRGDPVYNVQSPSSRRQSRPQKVVSYDYPQQARYEYVDNRGLRDPQYQQRVEYVRVPVDYEDSRLREPPARYLVSRPVEQLEPEYVRYEQTYTDEPIYTRNGQIYRAPPRAYQEQPSRAAPPFTHSYI